MSQRADPLFCLEFDLSVFLHCAELKYLAWCNLLCQSLVCVYVYDELRHQSCLVCLLVNLVLRPVKENKACHPSFMLSTMLFPVIADRKGTSLTAPPHGLHS